MDKLIWIGMVGTVATFSVLSAFLCLPAWPALPLYVEIQMLTRRMVEIRLMAEQKT